MQPTPESPLRSPLQYISRIRSLPEFTGALGTPAEFNQLPLEQKQTRRARGIARAALSLHDTLSNAERPTPQTEIDKSIFRVIGSLDGFYQAQLRLDRFEESDHHKPRHEQTDYEVKRPYIETVAAFNHAIREVIDQVPKVKFSELLDFLVTTFEAERGQTGSQRFEQMASAVMHGMRHELAAEQIIGTIPGAEIIYIDPRNKQDEARADRERVRSDMKGRDIRVRIGGREVNIDIKASERSAEKAKSRSRHPERIIWSGISNDEFGDSLRISPQLAAQKSHRMTRELLRAAFPEKYQTKRHQLTN